MYAVRTVRERQGGAGHELAEQTTPKEKTESQAETVNAPTLASRLGDPGGSATAILGIAGDGVCMASTTLIRSTCRPCVGDERVQWRLPGWESASGEVSAVYIWGSGAHPLNVPEAWPRRCSVIVCWTHALNARRRGKPCRQGGVCIRRTGPGFDDVCVRFPDV